MGICGIAEVVLATAEHTPPTPLKIRLTAEIPLTMMVKILIIVVRIDVPAENIIRIAEETGATTGRIFKGAGDTDVVTKEIFGATAKIDTIIEEITAATAITGATTEEVYGVIVKIDTKIEEIYGITADSGRIIRGIFERTAKRTGITNDIIPRSQTTESSTLPGTTARNIQAGHTVEEAGEKLTDVRFTPVQKTAATHHVWVAAHFHHRIIPLSPKTVYFLTLCRPPPLFTSLQMVTKGGRPILRMSPFFKNI